MPEDEADEQSRGAEIATKTAAGISDALVAIGALALVALALATLVHAGVITGVAVDITVATDEGDTTRFILGSADIPDTASNNTPTSADDRRTSQSMATTEDSTAEVKLDSSPPPAYPPRTDHEWDESLLPADNDPGTQTIETGRRSIDTEAIEQHLIAEINAYRSANNRNSLEYSHYTAGVACAHSYDMATRDFFAHTNPDGEEPWDRVAERRHCAHHYGENIAKTHVGFPTEGADTPLVELHSEEATAETIFKLWEQSPEHNELMLSDLPDAAGIGVYATPVENKDGVYEIYATLNTCRYIQNPVDD